MNKYIENYVSEKVFALIGIKAIVFNKKEEVLLLRRSKKCDDGQHWSLPGGGLEKGEDPVKGVIREVKEETGLKASDIKPINVFSYTEKNGDFAVLIIYKATSKSEKVKLNWEHDEYKWLSQKQALALNVPEKVKELIKLAYHSKY